MPKTRDGCFTSRLSESGAGRLRVAPIGAKWADLGNTSGLVGSINLESTLRPGGGGGGWLAGGGRIHCACPIRLISNKSGNFLWRHFGYDRPRR